MLVKSSGEAIKAGHGWRTVCLLISSTGLSPEACRTALEALRAVAQPPVLSTVAFPHCLETATTFIDSQNKVGWPLFPQGTERRIPSYPFTLYNLPAALCKSFAGTDMWWP